MSMAASIHFGDSAIYVVPGDQGGQGSGADVSLTEVSRPCPFPLLTVSFFVSSFPILQEYLQLMSTKSYRQGEESVKLDTSELQDKAVTVIKRVLDKLNGTDAKEIKGETLPAHFLRPLFLSCITTLFEGVIPKFTPTNHRIFDTSAGTIKAQDVEEQVDIILMIDHIILLVLKVFARNDTLPVYSFLISQVNRLILQASSIDNLCLSFVGWCPFW